MNLPIWLYQERWLGRAGGLRLRRYGSRRPLRLCLTVLDEADGRYSMPPSYMFALGKLGIQYGPEDGVSEGFTSMPRGARCKLFSLPNGLGLGLTWDGRSNQRATRRRR